MQHDFSRRVAPYVKAELGNAQRAKSGGHARLEFFHLERAHVIGQESTYWHVKVHVLMLAWSIRQRSAREALGQVFRIVGAAIKTVFGLVPSGNTGGANVSPFKAMPVEPELADLIQKARAASWPHWKQGARARRNSCTCARCWTAGGSVGAPRAKANAQGRVALLAPTRPCWNAAEDRPRQRYNVFRYSMMARRSCAVRTSVKVCPPVPLPRMRLS